MTLLTFFGAQFVALAPLLSVFVVVLSREAKLIVVSIISAFMWCCAATVAAMWWFIIPPLRREYVWVLIFAVAAQELFRYYTISLYKRTMAGFARIYPSAATTTMAAEAKAVMAIAFGFALGSCGLMSVTVIAAGKGPGALFAASCPEMNLFFLTGLSAFAVVLLNFALTFLAYDIYRDRPIDRRRVAFLFFIHLAASYSTMLNESGGHCAAALVLLYLFVAVAVVVALRTLKVTILWTRSGTALESTELLNDNDDVGGG